MAAKKSPIVAELFQELSQRTNTGKTAAKGMPGAFYTSDEFLAVEEEEIFRKEWVCLGHAGEIPEPGDYFTTELVGEPLLVVRGDDGKVNVLSNVCRHRGNLVITGKGNKRLFVCPYHAWSYDRKGALKAAPLMETVPEFKKKGCKLPSLKTELWNNFIFVNLDGKAKALGPRLRGLQEAGKNYHIEERHFLHLEEDVWDTNWKCLTENFMEGYHLSVTHRKTLHKITPTALCRKLPTSPGYTAYASGYASDFPQREPFHPDLTEDEKRQSLLFCIYPSFVATTAPNCTLFMCLRPDDAGKVALRWGVIGHEDDLKAEGVQTYIDIAHAFNAEDREKLETLQKGLKSRFYEPGYLGPEDLEGTIKDFYGYLAKRFGLDAGKQKSLVQTKAAAGNRKK